MKFLSIVVCLIVWGLEGHAQQQKEWVGSWQYNAPQADYQYQKGEIVFSMEDKELKASLKIGENSIPGQGLEVTDDTATFSVTIDGQPIDISLKKEDEKLSGAATYPGTEIPITAEKSA